MKKSLIFIGVFLVLVQTFFIAAAGGVTYPSCSDSDGGINSTVFGSVATQASLLALAVTTNDVCNGDTLIETSCSPTNSLVTTNINCAYGCSDGACFTQDSDVIMKISSSTNAHGAIYSDSNYLTLIKYSDIFGFSYYNSDEVHSCLSGTTPANLVLRLSDVANAHAQSKLIETYNTDVCFGDLVCTVRNTGSGQAGEVAVVELSDVDNAHLALPGSGYSKTVYCSSASATNSTYCNSFDNRNSCWTNSRNVECTWTPPTNASGALTQTNADGGACCGPDEANIAGVCIETEISLCNNPWAIDNQIAGETIRKANGATNFNQYCAQVTGGVTTGYWYPVNTY